MPAAQMLPAEPFQASSTPLVQDDPQSKAMVIDGLPPLPPLDETFPATLAGWLERRQEEDERCRVENERRLEEDKEREEQLERQGIEFERRHVELEQQHIEMERRRVEDERRRVEDERRRIEVEQRLQFELRRMEDERHRGEHRQRQVEDMLVSMCLDALVQQDAYLQEELRASRLETEDERRAHAATTEQRDVLLREFLALVRERDEIIEERDLARDERDRVRDEIRRLRQHEVAPSSSVGQNST
ncbi:unnamed protein product [Peniophora sp. CBMAI 1063]|nr:unnamed protein product [Peniophora sp. CBMAI 1063]